MINKDELDRFYTISGKRKMLSRQFEEALPRFYSHVEAKECLKSLFGEDLVYLGSQEDEEDDQVVYCYTIVHDRPGWEEGTRKMKETGYASGSDFIHSSQDIQIYENGRIWMVY
ncbi:hypothetical protein SAMN04487895_10116 [Paenibacillus sophorae]|uniref:Uncharacterized protein n=1 Tax=Paenibacillus sophorae TaxID=1333845 RepID=A0A1H8F7Z6_9BACL|nr:hypothetical protein [Paenibacillus sophorae]QWU13787.1 hypothetical protein KP014_17655 [Paenibacillus sophorae]SEN27616.1 hypothetical protein SAMN04487895_10116 [Paenibacillus sophorae]